MDHFFRDRADAGCQLAQKLQGYAGQQNVLVLALPRGGAPVGYALAQALHAPLDALIVRKLGAPRNPELAMGSLASGGIVYLNHSLLERLHVTEAQLDEALAHERVELCRRELAYRGARAPLEVSGKTVIVVDDGMATGASMQAALQALRSQCFGKPAYIVITVPVCPRGAEIQFKNIADEFVYLQQPNCFGGVGQFYANFDQTSDAQVRACLATPT